ncbi:nucleoside deaminase [Kitasatospora phosalacinea]|uniref:nucleoside deaminase n=1 Tax=Kitasatospora phosalacinea TaxID=2065 RepID=UPI003663D201
MITPADEVLLRRAVDLAARAVDAGDAPYGSLLAAPDGTVLAEAHNTVRRERDITAHPELKLARWAGRELDPAEAARTTLYTSCEPCGMCAGALVRSGLGRVVFALSTEQLVELNPASGDWPVLLRDGPALFAEARAPIEAYYRPAAPPGP